MPRLISFLLYLAFLLSTPLFGQQQPKYFTPVPIKGQRLMGSIAANDGAFGLGAKKVDGGFLVKSVAPGSPAERAGIQNGDTLITMDGKTLSGFSTLDFIEASKKNAGETLRLSYVRNGQKSEATSTLARRAEVYPNEAKLPATIAQPVFDGRVSVTAELLRQNTNSVVLSVLFSNPEIPLLNVDDAKFFVLDGEGQQLQRLSLDEVRFSIQQLVAQKWHGGNYPPATPPPPQRRYVITGTEMSNYTITELGSTSTISGISTGSYTVQQRPDYNQLGYMVGYSLGMAIRQHRDRKYNQNLLQQAQAAVSSWETQYFKSQTPMIAGENRTGGILYWSGGERAVSAPFRVVLFMANPETKKDEIVTFTFQE